MSDQLDHANAARSYLARLSKHPADHILVEAAKAEAYLALAVAMASRPGPEAEVSRQTG